MEEDNSTMVQVYLSPVLNARIEVMVLNSRSRGKKTSKAKEITRLMTIGLDVEREKINKEEKK